MSQIPTEKYKAFDALELVDGELRTLPPYAVMEAN